jgi:hypothetical protein
MVCKSNDEEIEFVRKFLTALIRDGVQPHEITLFVRSAAQLDRAKAAAGLGAMKHKAMDEILTAASP